MKTTFLVSVISEGWDIRSYIWLQEGPHQTLQDLKKTARSAWITIAQEESGSS